MFSNRIYLSIVIFASLGFMPVAQAETISFAAAMTKLAGDCGGDIRKFCHGVNLGNGRLVECLAQHSSGVSPVCKTSIESVTQSISRRREAQSAYLTACRRDIARRCKDIKGDGFTLACLNRAHAHIERQCRTTITDAGWR